MRLSVARAAVLMFNRKRLSGTGPGIKGHDDNVTELVVRTNDGPNYLLDKQIKIDLSVDQLVSLLPGLFKQRLREALNYEATKGETQA